MTVQCREGLYEFHGENEQQLRDFTASFRLKLYGLNLGRFDPKDAFGVDLALVRQFLLSFLKSKISPPQYDWTSKDQYILNYQTLFFIVSLTREEQGYHAISSFHQDTEPTPSNLSLIQCCFPSINMNHFNPIYEYMLKNYIGWSSTEELEMVNEATELYLNRFFAELSLRPNEASRTTLFQIMTSGYFMAKMRPFKASKRATYPGLLLFNFR